MELLNQIDPFIDYVTSLRGQKAIVGFLIMFGYMMKMTPVLPNRWIPIWNCFVIGPALSIILLGWPGPGELEPGVLSMQAAAALYAYQKGFMLACVAWLFHKAVLQWLEKKRGALSGHNPALPLPPDGATPAP